MRRIPLVPAALATATLVAVLAVLFVVRQNVAQTSALRDHNNLVVHTYEVQRTLNDVRLYAIESESAARGFFLSGDSSAIDRYRAGRRDLDEALSRLSSLGGESPAHADRLARLRAAVDTRMSGFDRALAIGQQQGVEAGFLAARTDTARLADADIRAIAAEIAQEEEVVLAARRLQVDVAYRSAIRGRIGSGILSVGLIIGIVALMFVQARSRQRRELRLRRSERRARDAANREQKARAEAERANQLKDEFLAVLSHELRTPLNAVLGWTQILQTAGSNDPTIVRALAAIKRNGESQQRLVEDLLDVSRIVTGKFSLEQRAFELRTPISAAVDAIRPAAQAKGVEVSVVLNGPAIAQGDPDRIQQVAANLLSNAVKFTPEGGRVDVSLVTQNGHAELVIHDTGCGIPPELRPHVFDRFRTGDGSPTRAHGGLGLGLAIAKHIVDAHGGSIEVRSDGSGQGSTFHVRLPAA